ncbi:MAG: MEDS domain-containing protein [Solirubrobacterales bacterium]
MREHGSIGSGGGLGGDGHACWAFDHGSDFAAVAVEFLDDGLRAGQRLAYVGSEAAAEQRERLDPLGDVGSMIDAGGCSSSSSRTSTRWESRSTATRSSPPTPRRPTPPSPTATPGCGSPRR